MNILNLIITPLILTAAACSWAGGPSASQCLEDAETAVNAGKYDIAQQLCDSMVSSRIYTQLSTAGKCDLAMLLTSLAERVPQSEDVNTASATLVINEAHSIDADSVNMYIDQLPLDRRSEGAILRTLLFASQAHDSIPGSEDPDYILLTDSLELENEEC